MKGKRYEAHLPTEQAQARKVPWLPCSYVHSWWSCCTGTPSRQGPQASDCLVHLKTIKSSAEITRLFKEGQRVGTKDITLIVMRNEKGHDHHGRAAFIAGKKLGNAVWRNRAKRRMRSLCRDLNGPFAEYDVLFVARRSINDVSYEEMKRKTKHALVKTGIILV